ncbi:hypothetical protein, partial [Nocardioides sp. YIM 152588]|uniref:hypothetical protein n=1 Tax=Nocardioides sp. YIM 152588 TaxID=3158259 RepID=UPI0032E43E22
PAATSAGPACGGPTRTPATGRPADPALARIRAALYAAAPIDHVARILRRVAAPLLLELPPAEVHLGGIEDVLAVFGVPGPADRAAGPFAAALDLPTTVAGFWAQLEDAGRWRPEDDDAGGL